MRVADFDFNLPEACIALRPVVPRDSARLLQVRSDGALEDHIVSQLSQILQAGDVLVLNDTKVFAAQLSATRAPRKHGGGGPARVSINLHKQVDAARWKAFARPAKRLKTGDHIQFGDTLSATVEHKGETGEIQLLFNQSGAKLTKLFQQVGQVPLPPYIGSKRAIDARDDSDYQTIFAQQEGSVAAPTAGLHFTEAMLAQVKANGILICFVTLHVGAGTFLPVSVADTQNHIMHSEWREIPAATASMINLAKQQRRRVIAVGTTSLRSLESAASDTGQIAPSSGDTDIFITPGYRFKLVDGLLTNFHLPKSTLFMLVSAFCGLDEMQNAYAHAIKSGYRFYSYGDACLLWRQQTPGTT